MQNIIEITIFLKKQLGRFVNVRAAENTFSRFSRPFSKWCLEFLRNMLTVSVVLLLAQRTHNLFLQIVALASRVALLVWVLSFLETWHISFVFIKNRRIQIWVEFIVSLIVATIIIRTSTIAFRHAFNALLHSQMFK
jgi:hypothetical protein